MAQETEDTNLQVFAQLINMGFDDHMSINAARKYDNINEAIEWITNKSNLHRDDNTEIEEKKLDSAVNDTQDTLKINAFCDDHINCISIQRIIQMLQFYHNNHDNYTEIEKYLQNYKQYLLSDYHHILSEHLNENKISSVQSNEQFKWIYDQLHSTDDSKINDISCNIGKCKVYARSNREREKQTIECNDRKLLMMIDIMDTIHCYFMHSVDIGYRIIQQIHDDTKENDDQDEEITSHDPQMERLKAYLSSKRRTLLKLRGNRRFRKNKFMTDLSSSYVFYSHNLYEPNLINNMSIFLALPRDESPPELHDANSDNNDSSEEEQKSDTEEKDEDEDDDVDITKEGHLQQPSSSLYSSKLKDRFVILKENHLFCYTDPKKTEIAELINLAKFEKVEIKNHQFILLPLYDNEKAKTFVADSEETAHDWTMIIQKSIYLCTSLDKQQVIMEGYLQQKKMVGVKKAFFVLKHHYLFCYDNHKKSKLNTKLNLTSFKNAVILKTAAKEFRLNPSGYFQFGVEFVTDSTEEAQAWVRHINECLNPSYDGIKKAAHGAQMFHFGIRRNYWGKSWRSYRNYPELLSGKYQSIKEEVTSNKMCCISVDAFNDAYNKASYLIQTSPFIRNLVTDKDFEGYGIIKGSRITVSNVLSVVLYTDYDSLSYRFSSTFRKIYKDETEEYTLLRAKEFYNWSKKLIETVNTYGTCVDSSNIKVYYHGVSLMYFNRFQTLFDSPTSTTTKLQIAHIFSTDDGIILELQTLAQDMHISCYNSHPRYFNCSFVSAFANEEERLFIQPYDDYEYLQILSIRNVSTSENYMEYIEVLRTLQTLIVYNRYSFKAIPEKYIKLINKIISVATSSHDSFDDHFPSYAGSLIQRVLENGSSISDDVGKIGLDLKDFRRSGMKIDLIDSVNKDLVALDTLNMMFKWVKKITVHHTKNFDCVAFWNRLAIILENINKLTYSKLKNIQLWTSDPFPPEHWSQYKSICQDTGWNVELDKQFKLFELRRKLV